MNKKLGFIKRIGILSILCFCLGFVVFSNSSQTAAARPCCTQCPLDPNDFSQTPGEYCENQCGSSSGSCYTNCINSVYSCWRVCDMGC